MYLLEMRMIDLDTLEIFRAVARDGGIVRAAGKLNRVPSNVTTRIKQLEERLAVQLFQKRGRTIVLTEAGQTLLTYADRLLTLATEAECATQQSIFSGQLHIGSMESSAASRLPKILAKFHRQHPDVRLTIETGTTGALLTLLRDYRLQAAFVGEPFEGDGLTTQPVFTETLVLVTAKSHGRVTRPSDLVPRTLLAFSQGCSYRKRLEQWLAGGGNSVESVLELASYQAILACAAAGAGFGIMPQSVIRTIRSSGEIRCHDLPAAIAKNTTHLAWTGDGSPQLDLLRAMLAQTAEQ